MKKLFLLFTLVVLSFSVVAGQVDQAEVSVDCTKSAANAPKDAGDKILNQDKDKSAGEKEV